MLQAIDRLREKLLDYLIPPFPVRVSTGPAFFAYTHQKLTQFNGQYVCQLIDPLIQDLESENYTNIVFGQVLQPEAIPSQQVPHQIRWHELIWSIFFFHKDIFLDYKFIVTLLRPMSDLPFHWSLFTIRTLLISNYFALKIRKIANQADSAYVLVYYNAVMLGVVSAFRRLGKEAWDVQHGLLGSVHQAYNNSDAYLIKSNFRPSGFVVWDAKFGQYLENTLGARWKSTEYIHLKAFGKPRSKCKVFKTVLYTLQWETYVPIEVKNAVIHFNNIQWVFRKHPHEKSPRHDLAWIQDLPNTELANCSEPLVAVLSESDLHLTYDSSVVFEAAKLGIPSLLVSADNHQSFRESVHDAFSELIETGIASIVTQGNLITMIEKYIK